MFKCRKMTGKETNSPEKKELEITKNGATSDYVSEDPIILEAFTDVKAAILAKRTDIVRQILSAAQALRDDDEFDSDGEEQDKKELGHKYDKGEYVDLLSLLLLHKDTDSGTLLHYAARIGSIDIMRALLAAGANCTVKNTENLNPYQYCDSEQMRNVFAGELMQAVSQSRIFRIEQLLSAGIDINSCDGGSSNNSVLHWAVSFSDLATVKLVLEKGGKVNAKNGNGEVPLHDSIKRGDKDIVEELILHGANCHIVPIKGSCAGKSPLVLAQDKPKIFEILKKQSEVVENGDHQISPSQNLDSSTDKSTPQDVPSTKVIPPLITTTQLDSMFQFLCPKPKIMKQFNGFFFVLPTELTVQLVGKGDEILHLKSTVDLFATNFQEMGTAITFQYSTCACMSASSNVSLQCIVNKRGFSQTHEYKLQFTTNKVLLLASSMQSIYHGLSTLFQTLKLFKGKSVPLVQISDWPTHPVRSLIFDFKNNDAPNLNLLCEITDLLSLFKVNQIQLNVDHVIHKKKGKAFYTTNEFLEFQWFCKQRFIEIVPFVDLTSTPAQFLRDNSVNDQSEINEEELSKCLDDFVFSKIVHIKLSEGTNNHHQQLLKYCMNRDILAQISSPALPDFQLNQALNFMGAFVHNVFTSNKSELERNSSYVQSLGLNYNVCFKDSLLNRVCPDHVTILTKVHEIVTSLPTHSCHGFSLIYHGNDLNQLGNFSLVLPSLVIASSMGWGAPDVMNDEYVGSVANFLIYEDDHDIIGSRLLGLGRWLPLATTSDDKMVVSVIDDVIEKCSTSGVTITIDQIQEFCKQIKLLKSEMEKMKLHIRCRQFIHDELTFITEILFFVSRLCYSTLNDKTKTLPLELKNLSQVHKSDYSNKLMVLMKQNESFLQKYFKNSTPPESFSTMRILENILKNILPDNATSSSFNPGLNGVFTV